MNAIPTGNGEGTAKFRVRKLEAAQSELQSEHDKLWKLASNPFIVLGEARVTDSGIALTILGDLPPEPRLGLAPGSFPKTIEGALAMMHPDDRQAYQQAVERSQATGEPFDMNYRLADGHGGWRWIEGRAVSVEVRDGKHVGWVFTNRDFTPQREAEAALRQSLRDLEASRSEVKSGQDKLWKLAANAFSVLGEIRVTEDGLEMEYFGDAAPEAKIGLLPGSAPRTLEELIAMMHPDDIRSYQENVERSLATGEPFRSIYRLSDGRGGWRWLKSRAISLGEERNGKHVHWLGDSIDITEQKETEEALRQSLEELRQLKAQLQSENLFLREEVDRGAEHGEIIGRSAALTRVLEQVELVSRHVLHRPGQRRDRHGQGTGRPRHPPAQRPPEALVCGRQLRRLAGDPGGKRIVRPRERRLHGRHRAPRGPVRASRRRHALPG